MSIIYNFCHTKNKCSGKEQDMKTRKNKISYVYQNDIKYPSIKISGKWLKELNFNIGDEFKIFSCNGIIMLVKTK